MTAVCFFLYPIVAFKGAITELSSREWGTISAKSFYQWHCVNILSKSAVKTVSKLYKDSGSYSGLEYACTKKTCWSIKPNNEVLQFNTDANDACLLKQTGKVVCLASSCFSVAYLCNVLPVSNNRPFSYSTKELGSNIIFTQYNSRGSIKWR